MNIVTLIPVKNEEAILQTTLLNASKFSDFIIVADQHSTDRSCEIAATFPKVHIITNENKGHSNKVRWQLLDEARKIPGDNLMVAIDADEMISPKWFQEIKKEYANRKGPVQFSFKWIQLWNSFEVYRNDGVWKDSKKIVVWLDDRIIDYDRTEVINDHTSRVPGKDIPIIEVNDFPLLHFQFVFKKQTELKQVWYMMNEFIASSGTNARKINYKYSVSRFDQKVTTKLVDKKWFQEIDLPTRQINTPSWHRIEIERLFNERGIAYFESLDIWHVEELKKQFINGYGRNPKPQKYPLFFIKINNIKIGLKGFLNVK